MVRFENVGMRYSSGPEVLREGMKVLNAAATKFGFKFETTNYDIGGERYMKTGEILPDSVLDEFRKQDVLFLGAIGHPDVKPGILEKGILLKARFELEQYIAAAFLDDGDLQHRRAVSFAVSTGQTIQQQECHHA